MNIKVVVIDDEYLAIEELSFLLSKVPYIRILGKGEGGIEGLKLVEELKPDLVFVDVKMPDITGIQFSKEIKRRNIDCKIIFTTAYDQYAIEAFDVDAIDYILKPYEEERVLRAVSKAKDIIKNNNVVSNKVSENNIILNKLPLLKDDKLVLIDVEDILLIHTEDRNIYIKTNTETFISSYSLQELEERLKAKGFFRTHRSYLVNLNKIKEITPWFNGTYVATLEGSNKEVPISRNQVKSFKQILGI